MNLSKRAKIVIGALTVWPFLGIVLYFGVTVFWWFWVGAAIDEGASEPALARILPIAMVATALASVLSMFALELFYLIFLFRTARIDPGKKALWAVVLLLGAGMAMPLFFFLYVWPDTWPKDGTLTSSGVSNEV